MKLECQAFWDFGAKLGVETIEAVVKGSTLCAELGLDMNNATGAISFAMECYQRGPDNRARYRRDETGMGR